MPHSFLRSTLLCDVKNLEYKVFFTLTGFATFKISNEDLWILVPHLCDRMSHLVKNGIYLITNAVILTQSVFHDRLQGHDADLVINARGQYQQVLLEGDHGLREFAR